MHRAALINVFLSFALPVAAGDLVVFDGSGMAPGASLRRGESVRSATIDTDGVVMHRRYAPDQGTWDNLQVQLPAPQRLGERRTLRMSVNVVPAGEAVPARLRRIDLLHADGSGTLAFEADNAEYLLDGRAVPRKLWIDFDRDPQTWQELRLDLTTGPGLSADDAVQRLSIQFTNDLGLYVRDVRFAGPDGSGAPHQSGGAPSASAPFETRGDASEWPWVTDSPYRVMLHCPPLPRAEGKPLAWAAIDVDGWIDTGLMPGPGFDPTTVRVVEYDAATMQPVKQRDGESVPALLVPCKVEVYPRLPMPYHKSEVRRPRQVSWLRRDNGPERPIYAVYFGGVGHDASVEVPSPAALGTGDALAFGQPVEPTPARGTPIPVDFNGDGLLDLIAVQNTVPDRGTYLLLNHGTAERERMSAPIYLGPAEVKGTPQVADIDGDGKLDVGHRGGFFSDVLGKRFTRHIRINNPPEFDIWRTMPEGKGEHWSFVDWDGDGVRDVLIGGNYWWEYGWATAYDHRGKWTRGPLRGWFYFFRNRGTNDDFVLDFPEKLMTADGEPAETYGYASPVAVDIDRDGDLDLLSGDFLDQLVVFENIGTRRDPRLARGVPIRTTEGPFRAERQVVTPVVVDWDRDGDDDILLRCEGSLITLLENQSDGQPGMPVFLPERRLDSDYDRLNVGELPVVDVHDWDGDGDLDLIYGNSSGDLGWFENQGEGETLRFVPARAFSADGQPIRVEAGPNGSLQGPAEARWGYMVPDAADWDLDGQPDIMFNSIWGLIEWHRNPGDEDPRVLDAAAPVTVQWRAETPKPVWRWWNPEPGQWSTQWRCNVRMIDWDIDGLPDAVTLDTEGYLVLHERSRVDGGLVLGPPQRVFMGEDGKPFRANHVRPGNSGRIKFDLVDWDGDGDRDYIQVVPASWHRGNAVWYENTGSDDAPVLAKRGDLGDFVVNGHTSSPWWGDFDGNGTVDLLLAAEAGHFYFFSREYIDHKDQLQARPLNDQSR